MKPRTPKTSDAEDPYIFCDKTKTNKRHRGAKAAVSVALGLSLLFTPVLTPRAQALTPESASSAFRGSRYYLNLKALTLTGDERTDIVMVAMSQLGYHEGNSTGQFNGENKSGSNNYVEYNYYNGKVDQLGNGVLTYSYPWCASFVSYCARMAEIPSSTLRSCLNCAAWVNYFKEDGTFRTRQSGYVPRQGDIIFFRSGGSPAIATHVGIVRYVCNGIVYTIEGNSADQVRLASYSQWDSTIVGYGVPNYRERRTVAIDYLLHKYTEGNYIIAAETLPVRSAPSYTSRAVFTLHRGDLMHVYEFSGYWGRTDYGWIPMTDTQPIWVEKE